MMPTGFAYSTKHFYQRLTRRFKMALIVCVALLLGALTYLLLPKPDLANYQSYSIAIFDRNDKLLRISLAQDERYRLYTPIEDIAESLQQATILYEDQNYYAHSGVDYLALLRAFWQTYVLQDRRIGASTITMQVARLRWNIPSNTLSGKVLQIGRALQLSRHYSKLALLEAYLNLAPYGGNIEGIGAASLIYFDKPASALSLAEALTLAVVPQNPSKRNPAKQSGIQAIQLAKQRLLERWFKEYPQDQQARALLDLPLHVRTPRELPYHAPHFVQYLLSQQSLNGAHGSTALGHSIPSTSPTPANSVATLPVLKPLTPDPAATSPKTLNFSRPNYVGQQIKGSIDLSLQNRLEVVLQAYIQQHHSKGFNNASVLLLNSKTMQIEAMIGSADFNNKAIQGQVNGTLAKRSPGSTLKPFVYALALDAGLIHPMTMLKDLPKKYAGFAPENFGKGFVGPISAQDALIKSRNVPAVDLQYQLLELQRSHAEQAHTKPIQTFYDFLNNAGVSQLKEADFYGLALALGGGEVSMLELIEMYAVIANLGVYKTAVSTYWVSAEEDLQNAPKQQQLLSAEAAFLTFDMLAKNPAPKALNYTSVKPQTGDAKQVAWKTGTSWAFRDAWAVAISGDYILATWVGNFSGEGNNAFIGRTAAGPLLFRLLDVVKGNKLSPFDAKALSRLNLKRVNICKTTGDLYESECPDKSETLFIPGVSPIKNANIYRSILVDKLTGLRRCDKNNELASQKVFAFWPSDFQALFNQAGVHIEKPPSFMPQCELADIVAQGNKPSISSPQLQVNYVVQDSQGLSVSIPLQASADAEVSQLYWFANGQFIGTVELANNTTQSALIWHATPGDYEVQVSDDFGRSAAVAVKVQAVK